MTFVDPSELRRRQANYLRAERGRATSDDERARLDAEIRELTKFRWRRLLFPSTDH